MVHLLLQVISQCHWLLSFNRVSHYYGETPLNTDVPGFHFTNVLSCK